MVICKMVLADCLQAAEIEKESFSVPWSESSLENEFNLDYAVYFAAKEGETLLGYAGVHNVCGEGEITTFAVKPSFRNKGIGRQVLNALICFEKENYIEKINLEVRASNAAAISLYKSLGFEVCGERKNYYSRPTENAVLMTLFL